MSDVLIEILKMIDSGNRKKSEVAKNIAEKHGVTVQNVYQHLKKLEKPMQIFECSKGYLHLLQKRLFAQNFKLKDITKEASEYDIWIKHILSLIKNDIELKDSMFHVFTEMLNNAIEHSEGDTIRIALFESAYGYLVSITDNGVGIFKKICRYKNLKDEQHAMFELSKGRLTTMPEAHSGEGIFFSSKISDEFSIISHGLIFHHELDVNSLSELEGMARRSMYEGTKVVFKINKFTPKSVTAIFKQYTVIDEEGEYMFSKTIIKAKLIQYENEALVSRSQAKRLLTRVNEFKEAVIDFAGIRLIGQGFADEVFRVFTTRYPDVKLTYVNAEPDVDFMIKRAVGTAKINKKS